MDTHLLRMSLVLSYCITIVHSCIWTQLFVLLWACSMSNNANSNKMRDTWYYGDDNFITQTSLHVQAWHVWLTVPDTDCRADTGCHGNICDTFWYSFVLWSYLYTWCHMMSHDANDATWCHVTSHDITWCHVMSHVRNNQLVPCVWVGF